MAQIIYGERRNQLRQHLLSKFWRLKDNRHMDPDQEFSGDAPILRRHEAAHHQASQQEPYDTVNEEEWFDALSQSTEIITSAATSTPPATPTCNTTGVGLSSAAAQEPLTWFDARAELELSSPAADERQPAFSRAENLHPTSDEACESLRSPVTAVSDTSTEEDW